jgi:hypothetical protein
MVQASESPSRRSMTRRPGSGFRDTRPHGQRRGHRRVTSCRVIRCAIPQCRTPNLCSARRLPGHPCESDGSGSAGQRRASSCAPRPRVPRHARIRAGQRFGVAARIDRSRAGRTAGTRRCPQSSPAPKLRHDRRRLSSSVATQAATSPRARSHASSVPARPGRRGRGSCARDGPLASAERKTSGP